MILRGTQLNYMPDKSHVIIIIINTQSQIRQFHTSHNAPYLPPKILHIFCFYFPCVLQSSQEKLKTLLMQNFGGQIRCIIGDVEASRTNLFDKERLFNMKSCCGLQIPFTARTLLYGQRREAF